MRFLVTDPSASPLMAQRIARARGPAIPQGFFVQFGHRYLIVASDGNVGAVARALSARRIASAPLEGRAKRSDLHLVVQKGRTFQQDHPRVPVVLDQGRFLVVSLAPSRAARLRRDSHDYGIRPLEPDSIVFREIARDMAARAEPWVGPIVAALDPASYQADVTFLASLFTRHTLSAGYSDAAAFAETRLTAMGYTVGRPSITLPAGSSVNIIAEKSGGGATRELVIVCGHLDSANNAGGDSAAAPGADDNASGAAGVLAIARALASHEAEHDVRLVLFGGEEQGLHGSQQFVAALSAADRARLRAVVNMDMIGVRNTAAPAVLIEGSAVSQSVIDGLAASAAAHTPLAVQTSLNPFASDHVSFIEAGLPAVLTIEGGDSANSAIHTANDVLSTLDFGLAADVLRMNLGFVAEQIGQRGAVIVPPPPQPEIPDPSALVELFRYSGRYIFGGGASERETLAPVPDPMSAVDAPIFIPERNDILAFMANPELGQVPGPLPIPQPGPPVLRQPRPDLDPLPTPFPIPEGPLAQRLRFTLHVDIDGSDALNVVSGNVARGLLVAPATLERFIGRVTASSSSSGVVNLVVEDFSMPFPGGGICTRVEIGLNGAPSSHQADTTFVLTDGRRMGPHRAIRQSQFFREIEIEVDRESGARDPEPYDTHTHPDRPADLSRESLTIERSFRHAGIGITRSNATTTIASSAAGSDALWSETEMHDAMEANWSAFQNRPQWKMWVLQAKRATSATLGGIMFDGEIDEPGGVDRQGTAVFTECEFFHLPTGDYVEANPPVNEAAARELFFDLIHEMGHAFNLAHSFQKHASSGTAWPAPSWMPTVQDPQAMSWMNYPDLATESGSPSSPTLSATWFYNRFRFRFDRNELLFLRHAPDRFVQMGNEAWFTNHGRISHSEVDPSLGFEIRTRKPVFQLGEAMEIELKLWNKGPRAIEVPGHFDLLDGLLEIGITLPDGRKWPVLPFSHARHHVAPRMLEPGEALYRAHRSDDRQARAALQASRRVSPRGQRPVRLPGGRRGVSHLRRSDRRQHAAGGGRNLRRADGARAHHARHPRDGRRAPEDRLGAQQDRRRPPGGVRAAPRPRRRLCHPFQGPGSIGAHAQRRGQRPRFRLHHSGQGRRRAQRRGQLAGAHRLRADGPDLHRVRR